MPTDQRNLPAHFSGDADFQAWVQGIHDQLAACGLIQTSDTGQINPATVARPAGGDVLAGYEIWRFNDALQGSAPVFIRIEYRTGAFANDQPGLKVGVGVSTDGAGVLGSPRINPDVMTGFSPGSSKTAGAQLPSYCSGDGSRLHLCTNLDADNRNFNGYLAVQRVSDPDGDYSGDGVAIYLHSWNGRNFVVLGFAGTPPTPNTNPAWPIGAVFSQMGSVDGADRALLPVPILARARAHYLRELVYGAGQAIGELASFTVDHLGATRTMMPLGDGGSANSTDPLLAMPWE